MIKRLIEYLVIERKIEYIQYENSLKSNNARNYINYSTLKAISIKIPTKMKNHRHENANDHRKNIYLFFFTKSTMLYRKSLNVF